MIAQVCAEVGAGFEELDITGDPELVRAYGEQIPVTFVDGAQHDFWRVDERRLRAAVETVLAAGERADWAAAASEVFSACVAAVPYAPATAFLSRERTRLTRGDDGPARVALVADGVGAVHGVTRTLDEIRELTGQDYVDEYASKKADGIPAAEVAQVAPLDATGGNGHGADGDAPPRRSSAEVLQPRG